MRSRKRINVQFRAEFFNIFKTPFFEVRGGSTDVANADYGKVTQGAGQRNIQFGIRVLF